MCLKYQYQISKQRFYGLKIETYMKPALKTIPYKEWCIRQVLIALKMWSDDEKITFLPESYNSFWIWWLHVDFVQSRASWLQNFSLRLVTPSENRVDLHIFILSYFDVSTINYS